jgi:hypothetical protein
VKAVHEMVNDEIDKHLVDLDKNILHKQTDYNSTEFMDMKKGHVDDISYKKDIKGYETFAWALILTNISFFHIFIV